MPRWKDNVERTGVSCYVRWRLCRRRLLKMRGVAWKGGLQSFDLSQVSNITMEELQPGSNIPSVFDFSHPIMFFTAGTSCGVMLVSTSSPWFKVVQWQHWTTGLYGIPWGGCDFVMMIWWWFLMVLVLVRLCMERAGKGFHAPENLGKWINFSFPSFSLHNALRAEHCF